MTSNESPDRAAAIVAEFRNRRVLVLGDAILDEYLHGECDRISPEAPVPVVKVASAKRVLGGAANTAANIGALGGQATLIAIVGADESGAILRACAAEAAIDLRAVPSPGSTLRKTRVVSHQQQIVRLDYEDVEVPGEGTAAAILEQFDACVDRCDVVVISDYAKGFVSPAVVRSVIERAHQAGRAVVIDPRPQHRDCYAGCDYVTPNWREARALLRWADSEATPDAVAAVARAIVAELKTNAVLTLGPHGIAFCSRDGSEQFALPTRAREVFDVSGAGDTVVATFALSLASGADHATAVTLANRAAGVVVAKFGTATVAPEEILHDTEPLRLVSRSSLARLGATLRAKGKRVVTISGPFDRLDSGHLHLLSEARRQGDVLIVGLQSDTSIRKCEGPTHPVVPERQRAEMLLALRTVDYVHICEEVEPTAFLRQVAPDVHVNASGGGDHRVQREAVCADGAGIRDVERIPELSTSRLPASPCAAAAGR